jgi:hypothetical protein
MKTTLRSILLASLLFSSTSIFADDLNPLDPGVDPGVSAINDYVFPFILLGILIGYLLFNKRKKIYK